MVYRHNGIQWNADAIYAVHSNLEGIEEYHADRNKPEAGQI